MDQCQYVWDSDMRGDCESYLLKLSSNLVEKIALRSAEDLALRVPMLDKKDLTLLARVGALNEVDGITHRRDALWQMERAGKREGPIFRQKANGCGIAPGRYPFVK